MTQIKRQSPVKFNATPTRTEHRGDWTVVLEHESEGRGPWLVDLSHKTRWDLQDGKIEDQHPLGLPVPLVPGQCTLAKEILITRMNRTQATIYHLGTSAPQLPDYPGYTDISEATVFLAVFGPNALAVAEKLSNLDLSDPAKTAPFLLQGPFCHVPCQVVPLAADVGQNTGFLLTCSRGYADSMVDAIIKAGASFGLRPAGEKRFAAWLEGLAQIPLTGEQTGLAATG